MTNWKEYRLGEIVTLNYGKSLVSEKRKQGIYPVYSSAGITGWHNEPLINSKAIIIGRKGTVGTVYYSDKPFYCIDTAYYILPNDERYNFKFLYYLLKNIGLDKLNEDSAVPGLNRDTAYRQLISLPNLKTQTAIAEVLSSLDDKIELNNQITQNLEALAQTLFKQWFIDFDFPDENGLPFKYSGSEFVESELGKTPNGWKIVTLGEIVTKSSTGADAIKRAPIVDLNTGIRCARVGDMTNKRSFKQWGFCNITPQDYKRFKLDIDDIIVTRTASLGLNKIIRQEISGVYNNGLIRLKIDQKTCLALFIYANLQCEQYKIYIERISGDSSTRPNMQINYLLGYKLLVPSINLQRKFVNQMSLLIEKSDSITFENEELSALRDSLLPKLISGILKVSDVPILEPM